MQSQFGPAAKDYATSDVHARGESLNSLLQLVKPQTDWKVLDVATGAGHTAFTFAPFVSSVIAGDLTDEMLQMTAELAAERNLANVSTQLADANDLPFATSTFDLVTCRLAFHHFPTPKNVMAEFARVLKPGGTLGFTDNVTVDDSDAAEFYNEFERLRDPSHYRVYSTMKLDELVCQAGFEIQESRIFEKEFEFHRWADRQRVGESKKRSLLKLIDEIPDALRPLLRPRKTKSTIYFSLWERIIVARFA